MDDGMVVEKDGQEIATREVVVTNFRFGEWASRVVNVLERREWLFAGPQVQAEAASSLSFASGRRDRPPTRTCRAKADNYFDFLFSTGGEHLRDESLS
jgi:hypothetical protein